MVTIPTVHILGSNQLGGADRFFVRLVCALSRRHQPVHAVTRPAAPVNGPLRACGVEPVHLPLANKWDLYSAWRIRGLVRRTGARVVQTYMGRATRLTRVGDLPGTVHVARLGGFYKVPGYYRHPDAWVGNTRDICAYLAAEGLPAERIFYIGNFVDAVADPAPDERLAARRRLGLGDDTLLLFALGRLIPKKGFDLLLRALAEGVVGDNVEVHLVVCGSGPEERPLRALAEELGVAAHVSWAGWCDAPESYFSLADLFVCPSRHEPLGNVILEAWSHGLAVVSSATDGARSLVTEGRDGLLCPVDDATALAATLRRALAMPAAARRAMGAAGRERVAAEFSEQRIVDAYLDLYRGLLG